MGALGAKVIEQQFGIKILDKLPLSSEVTLAADQGRIQDCIKYYTPLAKSLAKEITRLKSTNSEELLDFKIKWKQA